MKIHDIRERERVTPAEAQDADIGSDPRVGELLGADPTTARVVLIGFPSDEGVRRNGGRPGAADAPGAIREQLFKMTPDPDANGAFRRLLRQTADFGDLAVSGDVERDQVLLGETLAPLLRRGAVPVILGGGHETAFGHFLGYARANCDVTILNWDAHTDVRPLKDGQAHSGSPFRQALEHETACCEQYIVAGYQPHSTARAHLDYIDEQDGKSIAAERVTPQEVQNIYKRLTDMTMATFDLDAVDQSIAPGVSAPAVDGLPAPVWLTAAYEAGRCEHVTSMDVVELNPRFDRDDATARLAALTVWRFLQGLASRTG